MASPRSTATLLGLASLVLCSCNPAGGGGAASSQPAASGAPSAAASPAPPPAASDTAASSAAASALPPVAAAAPPPAAPPPPARPAAIAAVAPKREPSPAELLRDDPVYLAKERTIDALYGNAKERDPTGQVEREQGAALAELHGCPNRGCLDSWFRRREAALKQYVDN